MTTTDNSRAAVRVCAIADAECSRNCGTGACKREREARYPVEQHEAAPARELIRKIAEKYCEYDAETRTYNILRYECDEDFFNCVRELRALPSAPSEAAPADMTAPWKTGTPPTKDGAYDEYIVAVRRKAVPGRVFVFASNYANNYGKEELSDSSGDEYIADGWYTIGHDTSGEFDSLFMPMLEDGDEVVGWQEMPKWNDSATAQPTPSAPLEGTGNVADERAAFLTWWCDDVPENMREGWKEGVDECLRNGQATDRLAGAWDGFQFGLQFARAPRTEVAGAVPKPVDLKARMDWAESILKSLPEHEPTYAIIDLLNDYDPDERDEILHSIRAYADGRATLALFTQYVPAQIPAADAAAALADDGDQA